MAKYFLIAGEASGDKHAAALMAQIKQRDPQAQFVGLGGSRMAAAECRLYQDYSHMAFMGFAAVLANLGQVRRNFRIAKEALVAEQPASEEISHPFQNLSSMFGAATSKRLEARPLPNRTLRPQVLPVFARSLLRATGSFLRFGTGSR